MSSGRLHLPRLDGPRGLGSGIRRVTGHPLRRVRRDESPRCRAETCDDNVPSWVKLRSWPVLGWQRAIRRQDRRLLIRSAFAWRVDSKVNRPPKPLTLHAPSRREALQGSATCLMLNKCWVHDRFGEILGFRYHTFPGRRDVADGRAFRCGKGPRGVTR